MWMLITSPIPKLFVKLKAGDMQATIDQIKTVWDKLTGSEEFTFTFVDEAIQDNIGLT